MEVRRPPLHNLTAPRHPLRDPLRSHGIPLVGTLFDILEENGDTVVASTKNVELKILFF
jgi:hypothetical protein